MTKFIIRFLLSMLIPLFGLSILYFVTDPYRTLKPFSLEYFDTTNRDYLSSELFLMNDSVYHYDSFIFGSSRGCGINTYHWANYLPEGSHQFLFQAWGETLTGIEQKITYIDNYGSGLKNAIVLLDIPGSFKDEQVPTEATAIKDPAISHQPRWKHQLLLLYNFIQKPSQWEKAIRTALHASNPSIEFDSVSNDWFSQNRNADISVPPIKDSLKNLSKNARKDFMHDLNLSDSTNRTNEPVINENFAIQLELIHGIFEKHNTDFRIIITPGYYYTSKAISNYDLEILKSIFGENRVYDYSTKNDLNTDYNNYLDPNHFGQFVGWHIIEDIYNQNKFE